MAVLDVSLYHLRLDLTTTILSMEGEGVLTSESARSSGLPAAIARSPAVTVRDRSSREYVERVLLAARERCG